MLVSAAAISPTDTDYNQLFYNS